jgi:hypothetical protein
MSQVRVLLGALLVLQFYLNCYTPFFSGAFSQTCSKYGKYRETARTDALVKKVETSIAMLREYRTALISAAVTGKIDVQDEAVA